MTKVQDQASVVTRENGFVMIDGPDGVAVTLTVKAALETSERLRKVGLEAQNQDGSGGQEEETREPSSP